MWRCWYCGCMNATLSCEHCGAPCKENGRLVEYYVYKRQPYISMRNAFVNRDCYADFSRSSRSSSWQDIHDSIYGGT